MFTLQKIPLTRDDQERLEVKQNCTIENMDHFPVKLRGQFDAQQALVMDWCSCWHVTIWMQFPLDQMIEHTNWHPVAFSITSRKLTGSYRIS